MNDDRDILEHIRQCLVCQIGFGVVGLAVLLVVWAAFLILSDLR